MRIDADVNDFFAGPILWQTRERLLGDRHERLGRIATPTDLEGHDGGALHHLKLAMVLAVPTGQIAKAGLLFLFQATAAAASSFVMSVQGSKPVDGPGYDGGGCAPFPAAAAPTPTMIRIAAAAPSLVMRDSSV